MSVYAVYADGRLLYSSVLQDPIYAVTALTVNTPIGEEGSAEITIPPTNRLYYEIHRMRTRIKVYEDDELIFSGRVVEATSEMDLMLNVTCEGDFALLLDSVFPPFKGSASVVDLLDAVIANHNAQVDDWKQFALGDVTISDATSSVSFDISGYSDSKSVLTDNLTDVYGGYFQTRLGTKQEVVPNDGEEFANTLQRGSRGEAVKLLQQRLIDLGYDVGSSGADGIFGANTQSGLTSFQTDHNLTGTGIYDKETHNVLLGVIYGSTTKTVEFIFLDYLADPYFMKQKKSTSTEDIEVWNAATDLLYYKMRGEKVKIMQERLIGLGYDNMGYVKPTGYFDDYTEYALYQFQRDKGLKVTRKYDKATHEKFMELLGVDQEATEETEEIEATTTRTIRFGVNLINMTREYPISDIFTVLLPLGDNDITIASENNGSIFLENAAAVKEFGRIVKTFSWSKATTPAALKAYADEYLKSHTMIFPDKLTVTAINLHMFGSGNERIKVGDWVEVVSPPHNINVILCCLEIQRDILAPENDQYILGYYIPANFDSDTSERVTSTSGNISRR